MPIQIKITEAAKRAIIAIGVMAGGALVSTQAEAAKFDTTKGTVTFERGDNPEKIAQTVKAQWGIETTGKQLAKDNGVVTKRQARKIQIGTVWSVDGLEEAVAKANTNNTQNARVEKAPDAGTTFPNVTAPYGVIATPASGFYPAADAPTVLTKEQQRIQNRINDAFAAVETPQFSRFWDLQNLPAVKAETKPAFDFARMFPEEKKSGLELAGINPAFINSPALSYATDKVSSSEAVGAIAAITTPETVTVKRGDTLNEIAQATDKSCKQIAKANGVSNVNVIEVGQVLNIAGLPDVENAADCDTRVAKVKNTRTHAVQQAEVRTRSFSRTGGMEDRCEVVEKKYLIGSGWKLEPKESLSGKFENSCGCSAEKYRVMVDGKPIYARGYGSGPMCEKGGRDGGRDTVTRDKPDTPSDKPSGGCTSSCGDKGTPNGDLGKNNDNEGKGGNNPPGARHSAIQSPVSDVKIAANIGVPAFNIG